MLPQALRSRTPDRLRDHPGIRAVALAAGLVPPRPMHTPAEAEALKRLAHSARCVVEIGVYEGSSALVFCEALGSAAELHLIDPYTDEHGSSMRAGWHGTPSATRRAIQRQVRGGGPRVVWHIERSQDVGPRWSGPPVDLVFVDGDHGEGPCHEDWDVWHPHIRPGGAVAFHDARLGLPDGDGSTGATAVVNALFRSGSTAGWRVVEELDTLVVVRREL